MSNAITIFGLTVALVFTARAVKTHTARIAALEAEVAQLRALVVDAETEVGK